MPRSTGLALDVAKYDNLSALRAMAGMVHGSGVFEGDKGGAGNMGMLNGVVIKFNTKIKERKSDDVDIKELRACNELRKNLAMRIVNYIKSEKEGITEDAVNEILSDLGVHLKKEEKSDANNAQVGAKSGDVIEKKAQVNKVNIADALSKKETMLTENDFEVNDDFMLKNAIKGDKYSQLLDVEDVSVNESTGEFDYGKVDESKLEGLVSRKKLLERTVIAKTLKKVEKVVSYEKPNTLIITNLKNRDLGEELGTNDITLNDFSSRGFKNASYEEAEKASKEDDISPSWNLADSLAIRESRKLISSILDKKFYPMKRLLGSEKLSSVLKAKNLVDFEGFLEKNALKENGQHDVKMVRKLLVKFESIVQKAVSTEMINLIDAPVREKSGYKGITYEYTLSEFRKKNDNINKIKNFIEKADKEKQNWNNKEVKERINEDYSNLLEIVDSQNFSRELLSVDVIIDQLKEKKGELENDMKVYDKQLDTFENKLKNDLDINGETESKLGETIGKIIETINKEVSELNMSEYKTEPKAVNQ